MNDSFSRYSYLYREFMRLKEERWNEEISLNALGGEINAIEFYSVEDHDVFEGRALKKAKNAVFNAYIRGECMLKPGTFNSIYSRIFFNNQCKCAVEEVRRILNAIYSDEIQLIDNIYNEEIKAKYINSVELIKGCINVFEKYEEMEEAYFVRIETRLEELRKKYISLYEGCDENVMVKQHLNCKTGKKTYGMSSLKDNQLTDICNYVNEAIKEVSDYSYELMCEYLKSGLSDVDESLNKICVQVKSILIE